MEFDVNTKTKWLYPRHMETDIGEYAHKAIILQTKLKSAYRLDRLVTD